MNSAAKDAKKVRSFQRRGKLRSPSWQTESHDPVAGLSAAVAPMDLEQCRGRRVRGLLSAATSPFALLIDDFERGDAGFPSQTL